MSRVREWMRRIAGMFRKRRRDAELEEELAAHLAMLAEENEARGMTVEEARRAARVELGGGEQIKEAVREQRGVPLLESLWQDVRFGLRMLRKNPGFACVAVLTLALGIGANTAIFTLIDAIMLRPLPIQNPQQLFLLRWDARRHPYGLKDGIIWSGCPYDTKGAQATSCSFSYPVFEQIRSERNIFQDVAAVEEVQWVRMGTSGGLVVVRNEFVSGEYFNILGLRPAAGRFFGTSDDVSGAVPAGVISYNYWLVRFGADPGAIGSTVLIEGKPVTIAGVAPPNFTGLDPGVSVDMWLPLESQPYLRPQWMGRTTKSLWLELVARPKEGVSTAQAQAAASALFAQATTALPDAIFHAEDAPHINLVEASHAFVTLRRRFEQPLILLLAGVGLLLLIASANIAGLMLARASAREKEMAVRLALGASKARLVRQVLTESVMISLAGGAMGIIVAYWGAATLSSFLSFNWAMPLQLDVRPDPHVLTFTFSVAVLIGVLFGLAPALRGTAVDLTPALKTSGGKMFSRFRNGKFAAGGGLVVAQVALSMVILISAGLFIRTLWSLEKQNFGFDVHNLLLFDVDTEATGFTQAQKQDLGNQLQEEFGAMPGVVSASYSQWWLLGVSWAQFQFRRLDDSGSATVTALGTQVGPGFFGTMGIPLLAGRDFTAADFNASLSPVPVVISRSLAQQLFGSENPLGRQFNDTFRTKVVRQVVGVAGDAKTGKLRGQTMPIAYAPDVGNGLSFVVRTSESPQALVPAIRHVLASRNSNLLGTDFTTQAEQIDKNAFQERLFAWLAALFGLLALVLVCIGLYGLLAYEVAQRAPEIGVRRALGALPRDVLRLFVTRGLALVATGLVIGVGVALGVTRLLRSLLYGVAPNDWLTIVTVVVVLGGVGILACYMPARRAMRVDPMVALRHE